MDHSKAFTMHRNAPFNGIHLNETFQVAVVAQLHHRHEVLVHLFGPQQLHNVLVQQTSVDGELRGGGGGRERGGGREGE